MAHSTCNYRSYSYTTRSELAGRWEGRKAPQRFRRQWPMWERWRRNPPWSVFILRSWQGNIHINLRPGEGGWGGVVLVVSLAGTWLWLIEKPASTSSHTSTSFLLNAIKYHPATKYTVRQPNQSDKKYSILDMKV